MNLVDHIGNKVTVWTVEGNSMTGRTLITADEMGIVVESPPFPPLAPNAKTKQVFVPWNRVKYIDLLEPEPTYEDAKAERAQYGDVIKSKNGSYQGELQVIDSTDTFAVVIHNGHQVSLLHSEYEIVKKADRASVGDIVDAGRGNFMVEKVDGNHISGHVDGVGWTVPHGSYSVVRRAERARIGDTIRINATDQIVIVGAVAEDKVWAPLFPTGLGSWFGLRDYTIVKRDEPEKAQVGDTIQSKSCPEIKFVVGYVGAEYAFESPHKLLGWFMLKHGDYVILRRAPDDQFTYSTENGVNHTIVHPSYGQSPAPVDQLCEPADEKAPLGICPYCNKPVYETDTLTALSLGEGITYKHLACLPVEEVPEPDTSKLVDMLAKRKGVETKRIGNYARVAIYNAILVDPLTWYKDGPATILVIPGGDS